MTSHYRYAKDRTPFCSSISSYSSCAFNLLHRSFHLLQLVNHLAQLSQTKTVLAFVLIKTKTNSKSCADYWVNALKSIINIGPQYLLDQWSGGAEWRHSTRSAPTLHPWGVKVEMLSPNMLRTAHHTEHGGVHYLQLWPNWRQTNWNHYWDMIDSWALIEFCSVKSSVIVVEDHCDRNRSQRAQQNVLIHAFVGLSSFHWRPFVRLERLTAKWQ